MKNRNDQKSLSHDEPLHGHILQAGAMPGEERLAVFQEALRLRNTPPLYSQETVPEKQVSVKFFDPCGSWTWYAAEWDGKELCFGYVVGFEREWGYFHLRELASARGKMDIGIEVDEWFTPQRVRERKLDLSKTPQKKDRGLEIGD